MDNSFFATVSRMKYIERWALMRSVRAENLSEHSLEVAMIAHALCIIGNVRYGKKLDAEKAALLGIYHDASEIITGDMPTPVKYGNGRIKSAYKDVEHQAGEQLLASLPEDLREAYRPILLETTTEADEQEQYLHRLVKAADKISALIKCIEEEMSGNREYEHAKITTLKAVDEMSRQFVEVADFVKDFLPHYGCTLDELLG